MPEIRCKFKETVVIDGKKVIIKCQFGNQKAKEKRALAKYIDESLNPRDNQFCENHMKPSMKLLKRKNKRACIYSDPNNKDYKCDVGTAKFIIKGIPDKKYCKHHAEMVKPEGGTIINIKTYYCLYEDEETEEQCTNTNLTYNEPGKKGGRFCADHGKQLGLVNVVADTCIHIYKEGDAFIPSAKNKRILKIGDRCYKEASKAMPGQTRGICCATHASEGMVDVVNKKCKNCIKKPYFNLEGKSPEYCADHKSAEMINVCRDNCIGKDGVKCKTTPTYNYKRGQKPLYCKKHKEPMMINVRTSDAQYCCGKLTKADINFLKNPTLKIGDKCNTIGNYAYTVKKETNQQRYCASHKLPGMIDMQNPKCDNKDCEKLALYGIAGTQPNKCAGHREKNMVLEPRKKCIDPDCKKLATHGNYERSHCEEHKLPDEINIVEKKCNSCGLEYIITNAEGICRTCDPTYQAVHVKEHDIKMFLIENKYEMISHDKTVQHGVCGKERPDFVFESNSKCHIVIVEVDEHQHNSYVEDCEIKRMINISQALGLPTIFIRYNPDEYKSATGKVAKSQTTRKKQLKKWLDLCLDMSPDAIRKYGFVSQLRLFYDGYSADDVKIQTILKIDDV